MFCFVFFPVIGDDVSTATTTDEIDLFEEEQVFVKDLNPNTKYTLQLIAKNKHGETAGPWEDHKTTGAGEYNNILAMFVSLSVFLSCLFSCFGAFIPFVRKINLFQG